jgi:cystathionine beta-lyase family protein involved in aluminum resistance
MARDTELQQKLIEDVKKAFNELDSIREYGVKKFTTAYCVNKVAEKFYRSPKTIEGYIYGR